MFAEGLDTIGGVDIDERDTMRSADPLQVHGNTIRHDVGSRISGKLIVVAIGDAEGIEGLSNIEGRVFGNRIASDGLGGGDNDEVNIAHAMFICWCYCYSIKANTLAMVIDVVGAKDGGELEWRIFGTHGQRQDVEDLVTRELFTEGEAGSAITKVTIAAAMDGVGSRADVIFGEEGN